MDAKLHPNSEESGSSFDNLNSVWLSSGTASGENQPTCDRVTAAYLHHMQNGKFVQPFGCLLALDEKTFRVIAYSQNASEMLTMVSHAVPGVGDHPALGIGTDIRTIFTASSAVALQKALAVLKGDGFKFHEDDHREVIAEVAKPGLEPYLGLHYPTTDILQVVVNDNDNEDGNGSDVVQPQKRKRIWGLVVCHNTTPRFVPFSLRDKVWRLGVAPSESHIRELALWPSKCHKDSTGLSTDSLSNAGFPGAAALGDVVCGMATVRISSMDVVFWFRSHTAAEIRWGGAKHEPGERDDPTKMSPRSSYKAFLEVVKGRSLPWKDYE
ncbi:hypothetical protein HN51_012848 [Arachis hypogaea]